MANKDSSEFASITGQKETAEPLGASTAGTKKGSLSQRQQSSQSSVPTLRKSSSSNLAPTMSSPLAQSPRTSRNTSPIRKDKPPTLSGTLSTQPSAAAIQRALSASNVPQLQQQGTTVSEAVLRLPRGQKSTPASGESAPQWPISPRLKSPPPSGPNSRRGSSVAQKKPEQSAAPSIQVLSSTPQSNNSNPNTPPATKQMANEDQRAAPQLQPPPPPKASARGPGGKSMLETVQENSGDAQEPSPAAVQAAADLKPLTKLSEEETQSPKRESSKTESETKHTQPGESGSESAENKSDGNTRGRRSSMSRSTVSSQTQKPRNATSKSSYGLSTTKSRQGDGKQNMTVETETVQSIPQSALAPANDRSGGLRADNSGSVRLKPSNETIRPKKERKKAERKTRSVNQGTGMYYTAHSPFHQRPGLQDRPYVSAYGSLYDHALQQRRKEAPPTPNKQESRASSSRLRHELSLIFRDAPAADDNGASSGQSTSIPHHFKRALSAGIIGTLSDRYVHKATSKADLFEARVANAVDEANTSDSDETFVYESNPPEPQRRQRHHSRTPSATSSHSMADQQRGVLRNYGDPFDDRRRVGGKRSMKFSSNPYNDVDSPESKDGTIRSHTPRHIGRFGRGGHHSANYEQDSPFTQASKLRQQNQMQRPRPNSPKSPQSMQFRPGGLFSSGNRKQEHPYDFDTEQIADDERTPLMGTVRGPRGNRTNGRRFVSSTAHSFDDFEEETRQSWCTGRIGACCLTTLMVILVIVSAICFVFASNRPLYNVELHKIKNVLASEQELMLDLVVGAVNPNTLQITVGDMDVNIFAKSKHVGLGGHRPEDPAEVDGRSSKRERQNRSLRDKNPNPSQDLSGHWHAPHAHDSETDSEKDSQTMLLGRIFHFDQALLFEASPIKQYVHYATGQVRLTKPGNKTESGGSERWEEVIQYPFELIVRGTLKYQLPISSRLQSATVGSRVMVYPDEVIDGTGNMRVEPIDHSEHWQWIDWPDVMDPDDDKNQGIEGNRVEELD